MKALVEAFHARLTRWVAAVCDTCPLCGGKVYRNGRINHRKDCEWMALVHAAREGEDLT